MLDKDNLRTINDCYIYGCRILNEAKIDDANFESCQLTADTFDISATDVMVKGDIILKQSKIKVFLEKIDKRILGQPLQYLIGNWDFYNLTFKVGPGVLIPRPETEAIIDESLKFLNENFRDLKRPAYILDLCAGTGCIGITLADNFPNCQVIEIEKSEAAYKYLEDNIKANVSISNKVKPILFDIFKGYNALDLEMKSTGLECFKPDLIVSNPPYIRSKEIADLQLEVQQEPRMALDGGEDGLIFYDAISEKWLPFLNHNGMIFVECGEDQSEKIENMFSICCGTTFKIKDFMGIYRIVGGKFD